MDSFADNTSTVIDVKISSGNYKDYIQKIVIKRKKGEEPKPEPEPDPEPTPDPAPTPTPEQAPTLTQAPEQAPSQDANGLIGFAICALVGAAIIAIGIRALFAKKP